MGDQKEKSNPVEAIIGLRSAADLESDYGRSMAMMAMDLQLPVIVSEILNGKQMYNTSIETHIEDTVMDMDAYSAVLALTLAGKLLLLRYGHNEEDFEPDPLILIYKDNFDAIISRYAATWLESSLDMEALAEEDSDTGDTGEAEEQSAYATLNADFVSLAAIIEKLEEALKPVDLDASRLAESLHHMAEYFISETDGEVDDFCKKIVQAIGLNKL